MVMANNNMTVCCRFRPLSSKEKKDDGDRVCIRAIDSETFVFKDEKEEECTFGFDRVFYEESLQADVYEFLALPILRDAVKGINGTIITYGQDLQSMLVIYLKCVSDRQTFFCAVYQTGAGKTYTIEGSNILEHSEMKKGLLPRVVEGLFDCVKSADEPTKFTLKLLMVEIYMEKVRDLLDLTKDNIMIKENKTEGILLSGATEISLSDPEQALQSLSSGIVNRAVGETQMNMASSRSHCVYIFSVQQELSRDKRAKTGKVILVDLAGSEKVEKTGAEGKVLEEAKTINKSLSALGNVINALTCGTSAKASHIPYRDSKLTRILRDALGGNSRTALLCCCSPSPSSASETLSTLRFGTRAKHIKASPVIHRCEDRNAKKHGVVASTKDESCERILKKLKKRLNAEDVKLLEELFILEGIILDPNSAEDMESACEDVTLRTISSLQVAIEELLYIIEELKIENNDLKATIAASERFVVVHKKAVEKASFVQKIPYIVSFFTSWAGSFSPLKMVKKS